MGTPLPHSPCPERWLSSWGDFQMICHKSNGTSSHPPCLSKKTLTPMLLILLACCLCFAAPSTSPSYTLNLTWQIINATTGKISNSPSTWFPHLRVDLCDLMDGGWNPLDQQPLTEKLTQARRSTLSQVFYICLGHSQDWSWWTKLWEVQSSVSVRNGVTNLLSS